MLIVTAAAVLIVMTAKDDVAEENKYTSYNAPQSSSVGDLSGDSSAKSGEIPEDSEPTKELPEYARVNINLVTAEEISRCLLLPIETADEIVAVRELIGEYSDIYELLLVESLSEEQIARFTEFVEM